MINLLAVFLISFGLIEGIWGVLQIFQIIESGHPRFHATGSFYNPGPFGCFLSMILPVALFTYLKSSHSVIRIACLAYCIICLFIIPGSLSRTAWVSAVAGIGIVLYHVTEFRVSKHNRLLIFLSIIVGIIVCAIIIYHFKQDSADGRLFIWKIAIMSLDNIPFLGVGWQNVPGGYGSAQEAYFASGLGTEREIYLADAPGYLYNEYLQVAFAFGYICMLLFIALLVVTTVMFFKFKNYGTVGCMCAFAIACVSSYPLQFWEFKVAVSILIIGSMLLISRPVVRNMCAAFATILCLLFGFNTSGYDIGTEYQNARKCLSYGKIEEANSLAMGLAQKHSGTELLLFIGNNYQLLGLRDSAAYYYERAAIRIPNRLYPHYRLMKLWLTYPADSIRAKKEAEILINKTPKVRSAASVQMQYAAGQLLCPTK